MTGVLRVVGVGPGDPELMTLKAARVIGAAEVVAYFCRHDRMGHARTIAGEVVREGVRELRFAYPFTTERDVRDPAYGVDMAAFYDACAGRVKEVLAAGEDVVLLCEGDPFLYGSAMYVFDRLRGRFGCEVVPGVAAMSGCWSAAQVPMVHGDDVLSVLPATMEERELAERLAGTEGAVVMKLGRNLPKLRAALARAGRLDEAVYVERGTQAGERCVRLMEFAGVAPYFSLVLVPGRKGAR